MEDTVVGVVLISQQTSKLSAVTVNHCQVQGTEVFVEREIGEVVVDVEEEGILEVLRWLHVTNPVQFVYKY